VTLDIAAQIGISVLGVAAIILVARKNKWGFVCGLLTQPFWYITSWTHQQWGIFIISFAYTVSWSYGFYLWFLKTNQAQPKVEPLSISD
jgi:nicotinamide riboside transporter PnuC